MDKCFFFISVLFEQVESQVFIYLFVCLFLISFLDTEQSISAAHEKIAECKKEIQRAKRIRKNRQGSNPTMNLIRTHKNCLVL